jgi:heavy metal efflux system protein
MQLPIDSAGCTRRFIRLDDVASLELLPGPNQISRESGKWLVVATANVRGIDIGTSGYWIG